MKIQTDFVMSINGEAVTTEQTQPVFNPATRSVFAQVPDASKEQLDQTVDAAHRALKMWSATPADERQAALETYADLIESHAEELMSLLTAEQGKPRAGSEWEVLGSVAWLRAVASQRLPDEVVEETEERRVVTRYTPVGVVGAIVPGISHPAGYLENCSGCDVWLYDDSQAVSVYAALRSEVGRACPAGVSAWGG